MEGRQPIPDDRSARGGGQDLPKSHSMGVAGTVPPVQETLEKCGPNTRASAAKC